MGTLARIGSALVASAMAAAFVPAVPAQTAADERAAALDKAIPAAMERASIPGANELDSRYAVGRSLKRRPVRSSDSRYLRDRAGTSLDQPVGTAPAAAPTLVPHPALPGARVQNCPERRLIAAAHRTRTRCRPQISKSSRC